MGLVIMVNVPYEVLLATYNGEQYLEEFLDSVSRQTIPPVRILVSDDRSSDNTIPILKQWISRNTINVKILPVCEYRLGCTKNFERLLYTSTCDYIMLADQDDIWDSDKAELMISCMIKAENNTNKTIPILVHSDLRIVDRCGSLIAPSFFKYQKINPLKADYLSVSLQNIVTGCASLLNRSGIVAALPFPETIILHDWWLALVVSCTGKILYISRPTLSYRQHERNLVGAKGDLINLSKNIRFLINPSFSISWLKRVFKQLNNLVSRQMITNADAIENIEMLMHGNIIVRILAARKLCLSKHGFVKTLGLYLSIITWQPSRLDDEH